MPFPETNLSELIRSKAIELDIDLCGIARAGKLAERADVLKKWTKAGMHDRMGYLARDIEKRADPRKLFPETRSLVVVGQSYYSDIKQKDPRAPILSRYVYGADYHKSISEKLERLLHFIKQEAPDCEGRIYVDSGPLMEKGWAQEAGLGWQGKHSVIINREIGSFFFIGILLLNLDLEYDKPAVKDFCGECRLCIDACPTAAINDNRTIDARRCIANLTIENRGPVPEEIIPKLGGRVYGCDKCQEICPWNSRVQTNRHPEFQLDPKIAELTREGWTSITEDQYKVFFGNSAMKRVKFLDLKRNITAAIKSTE